MHRVLTATGENREYFSHFPCTCTSISRALRHAGAVRARRTPRVPSVPQGVHRVPRVAARALRPRPRAFLHPAPHRPVLATPLQERLRAPAGARAGARALRAVPRALPAAALQRGARGRGRVELQSRGGRALGCALALPLLHREAQRGAPPRAVHDDHLVARRPAADAPAARRDLRRHTPLIASLLY